MFFSVFTCASIISNLYFSFCLCSCPLQVVHKSVSLSTGVVFPVHCVCGLHHAAILYAGCHHRQCPNFCLTHPRLKCLPVHGN